MSSYLEIKEEWSIDTCCKVGEPLMIMLSEGAR